MKYLLGLLLLTSLNCFAQDYKDQITEYRKKYMDDFLTDQNSPLKKDDLQFLRFYDADSTYRVTAHEEILLNEPGFIMPVFSGRGREYVRYATLKFTLKGKSLQLTVYRNVNLAKIAEYKDYLFLPFTDDTNGSETYAGGRYIDLREGDFKGNTVVIDFNKAYNPYCAFSGGYACPKPPDENHLTIAIEAGEKQFAGEKKH
ncbi:DUF1684 domain-containing protein [Mucilaginibacter ginsenosidivorans]|uniref:DUF1684 domain-containing protein n=1 Tax=Mucilaginibacter ginsenosidivorans TaxID=398053 RepID=A0A5B8UY96_9SPHI|nr:DUF1684 domain-containing protein [Mucilaginibacter ginsenosidivorans]QEC63311.1 DUF1684 domain-containing protein [Mucilaginibacter ginsenosidivorans]